MKAKDVVTPIRYKLYDGYRDNNGVRLSSYNDHSGESYLVSFGDVINLKHEENKKLHNLLIKSMSAFVDIARDNNRQAQSMAKKIQIELSKIKGKEIKIDW